MLIIHSLQLSYWVIAEYVVDPVVPDIMVPQIVSPVSPLLNE
jgi:hypothetical protein